ncbi:hypothetical protein BDA96_01G508800 [Sorghum bicolor]|uniref:Uncharacterized protein n=2 Tax=Sorghum bicolor TaxID=4558 RepID=A0A921S6T9_SORBI|nr:hypothetical protein BDA96_01G508800 [Sorghum bicolor]OQU93097.1 hypothetical protein SORBI_3001G477350 [Sorghum bicolor]
MLGAHLSVFQELEARAAARRPLEPRARDGDWRISDLGPAAAGVQQRAPVREPGGAAGPGEELRSRCGLASDPRRCPPPRPPSSPARFFCPRQRASVRCPAIQSTARPARPDTRPWRRRPCAAQMQSRARAAYHQLKITFGHAQHRGPPRSGAGKSLAPIGHWRPRFAHTKCID